MTVDSFDPDNEDDGLDATERLLWRIKHEGPLVAYETALAICRDANAPAPAKATSLTALFRVAGYFERSDHEGAKQMHEMTAEELATESARLSRKLRRLERKE
jgi:hypothetical protein